MSVAGTFTAFQHLDPPPGTLITYHPRFCCSIATANKTGYFLLAAALKTKYFAGSFTKMMATCSSTTETSLLHISQAVHPVDTISASSIAIDLKCTWLLPGTVAVCALFCSSGIAILTFSTFYYSYFSPAGRTFNFASACSITGITGFFHLKRINFFSRFQSTKC